MPLSELELDFDINNLPPTDWRRQYVYRSLIRAFHDNDIKSSSSTNLNAQLYAESKERRNIRAIPRFKENATLAAADTALEAGREVNVGGAGGRDRYLSMISRVIAEVDSGLRGEFVHHFREEWRIANHIAPNIPLTPAQQVAMNAVVETSMATAESTDIRPLINALPRTIDSFISIQAGNGDPIARRIKKFASTQYSEPVRPEANVSGSVASNMIGLRTGGKDIVGQRASIGGVIGKFNATSSSDTDKVLAEVLNQKFGLSAAYEWEVLNSVQKDSTGKPQVTRYLADVQGNTNSSLGYQNDDSFVTTIRIGDLARVKEVQDKITSLRAKGININIDPNDDNLIVIPVVRADVQRAAATGPPINRPFKAIRISDNPRELTRLMYDNAVDAYNKLGLTPPNEEEIIRDNIQYVMSGRMSQAERTTSLISSKQAVRQKLFMSREKEVTRTDPKYINSIGEAALDIRERLHSKDAAFATLITTANGPPGPAQDRARRIVQNYTHVSVVPFRTGFGREFSDITDGDVRDALHALLFTRRSAVIGGRTFDNGPTRYEEIANMVFGMGLRGVGGGTLDPNQMDPAHRDLMRAIIEQELLARKVNAVAARSGLIITDQQRDSLIDQFQRIRTANPDNTLDQVISDTIRMASAAPPRHPLHIAAVHPNLVTELFFLNATYGTRSENNLRMRFNIAYKRGADTVSTGRYVHAENRTREAEMASALALAMSIREGIRSDEENIRLTAMMLGNLANSPTFRGTRAFGVLGTNMSRTITENNLREQLLRELDHWLPSANSRISKSLINRFLDEYRSVYSGGRTEAEQEALDHFIERFARRRDRSILMEAKRRAWMNLGTYAGALKWVGKVPEVVLLSEYLDTVYRQVAPGQAEFAQNVIESLPPIPFIGKVSPEFAGLFTGPLTGALYRFMVRLPLLNQLGMPFFGLNLTPVALKIPFFGATISLPPFVIPFLWIPGAESPFMKRYKELIPEVLSLDGWFGGVLDFPMRIGRYELLEHVGKVALRFAQKASRFWVEGPEGQLVLSARYGTRTTGQFFLAILDRFAANFMGINSETGPRANPGAFALGFWRSILRKRGKKEAKQKTVGLILTLAQAIGAGVIEMVGEFIRHTMGQGVWDALRDVSWVRRIPFIGDAADYFGDRLGALRLGWKARYDIAEQLNRTGSAAGGFNKDTAGMARIRANLDEHGTGYNWYRFGKWASLPFHAARLAQIGAFEALKAATRGGVWGIAYYFASSGNAPIAWNVFWINTIYHFARDFPAHYFFERQADGAVTNNVGGELVKEQWRGGVRGIWYNFRKFFSHYSAVMTASDTVISVGGLQHWFNLRAGDNYFKPFGDYVATRGEYSYIPRRQFYELWVRNGGAGYIDRFLDRLTPDQGGNLIRTLDRYGFADQLRRIPNPVVLAAIEQDNWIIAQAREHLRIGDFDIWKREPYIPPAGFHRYVSPVTNGEIFLRQMAEQPLMRDLHDLRIALNDGRITRWAGEASHLDPRITKGEVFLRRIWDRVPLSIREHLAAEGAYEFGQRVVINGETIPKTYLEHLLNGSGRGIGRWLRPILDRGMNVLNFALIAGAIWGPLGGWIAAGSYLSYSLAKPAFDIFMERWRNALQRRLGALIGNSDRFFKAFDARLMEGLNVEWLAQVSSEAGGPFVALGHGLYDLGTGIGQTFQGLGGIVFGNGNNGLSFILLTEGVGNMLSGFLQAGGVVFGTYSLYALGALLPGEIIALGLSGPGLVISLSYLAIDTITSGALSRVIINATAGMSQFIWEHALSPLIKNYIIPNFAQFAYAMSYATIGAIAGAVLFTVFGLGGIAWVGALLGGLAGGVIGWILYDLTKNLVGTMWGPLVTTIGLAGIGALIGAFFGPVGAAVGALIGAAVSILANYFAPAFSSLLGNILNLFIPIGIALLSFFASFFFLFRKTSLTQVLFGVIMMTFSLMALLYALGLAFTFPVADAGTGNGGSNPSGYGSIAKFGCPFLSPPQNAASCNQGNQDTGTYSVAKSDPSHVYEMATDVGETGDLSVYSPVDGTVLEAVGGSACDTHITINISPSDLNPTQPINPGDQSDVVIYIYHVIPSVKAGQVLKMGDQVGVLYSKPGNVYDSQGGLCWTGPHIHTYISYYNRNIKDAVRAPIPGPPNNIPYACPAYNSLSTLLGHQCITGTFDPTYCPKNNNLATNLGCDSLPVNGPAVTDFKSKNTPGCPLNDNLVNEINTVAGRTCVPPQLLAAVMEYTLSGSNGANGFTGPYDIRTPYVTYSNSNLGSSPDGFAQVGPLGVYTDTLSSPPIKQELITCGKTGGVTGVVVDSQTGKSSGPSLDDSLYAAGLALNSYITGKNNICVANKNACPASSFTLSSQSVPDIMRQYVCRWNGQKKASDFPSCGVNEGGSVASLYQKFVSSSCAWK